MEPNHLPDIEAGNGTGTAKTNGSTASPGHPHPVAVDHTTKKDGDGDEAPPERCLEVQEIAALHPESNINVTSVDQSQGLTTDAAARLRTIHGPNILTPPPKTPAWKLLLSQFQHIFLLLLIGSALLSIVAYFLSKDITTLFLGIILLVVVFFTGLGQFYEEQKANQIADSFTNMLASTCTVLRNGGQLETLPVDQLVVGDVVQVQNGEKVPADIVLLLSRGLKAECSSLTGESEPILCTDRPSPLGTPMVECKNMIFNSGLCFDGTGIGIVVRTGDATAIGTIAKLASHTKARESTLQREVRNFVQLIALVAICMAVICFTASVFLQNATEPRQVMKLFVNGFLIIVVANVPQGLPSTVVSLLSLAARTMAEKSVLVKRLDCVETLGSTSIICSDKTGTLTKNVMTVTDVWYNESLMTRHQRGAKSLHGQDPQALMYRCAILCNRAEPVPEDDKAKLSERMRVSQRGRIRSASRLSWTGSLRQVAVSPPAFKGNPSDVALLTYCDDKGQSVEDIRLEYPVLFEVPFNSNNKWQLVVVQSMPAPGMGPPQTATSNGDSATVQYEVLMKGAPEVILKRCSTYASTKDPSHRMDVTEAFRSDFNAKYEHFAKKGRRVLALCSQTFQGPNDAKFQVNDETDEYNFPTTNLNFLGLFAIMDPPRDNVPDAIAKCHGAGVKVFMVTGDHPFTACAIAKQVGLLKSEDNNIELLEDKTSTEDWEKCEGAVIHGSRIDGLSDDQWRTILSKTGVCFARTTPAHKLLIVKKCQTLMGAIVAVTGDGVNDAPALKQADVGVAMGLNGSAVAQDAADLLLMDDNFASIVDAIAEGRLIFDNIKKTVAYTMAHIFPEVFSAIIALLGGLPAGLTALQVLTIDLLTEMGPAISLAYEHAESDLMHRMPRDPAKDRLVSPVLLLYAYGTSGFIITAACMASYVLIYNRNKIWLSDFGDLDGDYFTLTSEVEVTIDRTGKPYSGEDQRRIFSEAATAFYITLTVTQFFHIFVCKTRLISLFTHGMFTNRLTLYGVAIGVAWVVLFSYVPGVQGVIGSGTVGWIPWVCAAGGGAVLWLYNEGSKWYFRRAGPDNRIVRALAW